MSTVTVSDNSSLSLTFPPNPTSALVKYLTSSEPINVELTEKQSPDAVISHLVPCGLKFTTPVTLGATQDELTIQPGLQGNCAIKTGTLFDPKTDDFGDSIPIPDGQAYVSASIRASLDAGLTGESGDLQFGFNPGATLALANYRLFDSNTKVASAVEALLRDFVIPGDLQDIESMTPGTVATIEGSGSLKFSATASLATATNPLATLTLGSLPSLSIKPSDALSLGVAVTLTGGYQVRVRRLEGRKFRLGFERKQGEELAVTASASAGVTAGVGGFDLLAALLKAISPDPMVDKDSFGKQTGLTENEVSTIAAAVKSGIDRSVTLSLCRELDLSAGSTAAFNYEVDLGALDDQGRQAVHKAIDGDLEGLEGSTLAGVQRLTSVFSSLREGKHLFKVNLLGIFNFGSVTDLLKNGRLIVDRETGAITIADQETADRIEFTSDNFAKDSGKLRKVLASSVTMTAGYTVGGIIPPQPTFSASCWSFEFHQATNRQNIQHYLHIVQALQLMPAATADAKLASVSIVPDDKLGPSTLHVDSEYAGGAFEGMFLQGVPGNKQPRTQDDYENIGRAALASLLPAEDINIERRRPLIDLAVWQAIRAVGSAPGIKQKLKDFGIVDDFVGTLIVDDYLLISWWAGAMSAAAKALADLLQFLKGSPKPDPQDNTFKKTRKALDDAMASVSKDAKPSFGEPWGLLVMAQASGLKDSTTATMFSPRISFVVSRP
jgi:hypothetical protein